MALVSHCSKVVLALLSHSTPPRIGTPVKNVDLIKRALDLVETIEERNGRVDFNWVRRGDNEDADRLANMGCDLAEERSKAARVCVGYALSGYANAYDSDSDTLYW